MQAAHQNECRVYRHAIRLLLEKNEALKGGSVEAPSEHAAKVIDSKRYDDGPKAIEARPALVPLDDEERARLAYLTEEQSKNKLCNHAMAASKLFELIDLRERAGTS